jgi:hypothetical protein
MRNIIDIPQSMITDVSDLLNRAVHWEYLTNNTQMYINGEYAFESGKVMVEGKDAFHFALVDYSDIPFISKNSSFFRKKRFYVCSY